MTAYSANLGFLYTEFGLAQAISEAARDGFAAVECHWPYAVDPVIVRESLDAAGVAMIGLNTSRGEPGAFGLSAVVGRTDQARDAIDEAVAYGSIVGARAVHVLAGVAAGPAAERVFLENLAYASDVAGAADQTVLVEALNPHDNPGYFVADTRMAADLIAALDAPNVRLMFDCYHVARTEGDVIGRFVELLPIIGHVQFAGVPDRGEPDRGTVDYRGVFAAIAAAGWTAPLGAEYRPSGHTQDSLGWMEVL